MQATSHLEEYLDELKYLTPQSRGDLERSAQNFANSHIATFSHQDRITGLLFGQVQSGKTAQMFGAIAATADSDPGFKTFILLTTNNINLQQQTLKRAIQQLTSFNVCDESDDFRFLHGGDKKPTLVILKKDTNVLKSWQSHLMSSARLKLGPVFILNDEADNASQNTKVNRSQESETFRLVQAIRNEGTSSIYLQVTATPQALLLQTLASQTRPAFLHYFEPGPTYLGGDFFFTTPSPFVQIQISEREKDDLLDPSLDSTPGLIRALSSFLITCAEFASKGERNCNFLVHPSVGKEDHKIVSEKIQALLKTMCAARVGSPEYLALYSAHQDLLRSSPNLIGFNAALKFLHGKPKVSVYLLNSSEDAERGNDFEDGFNIVVGGNTLGRGVTFSKLQTVYYVRSAKTPQADTYWQHSRMFGYDRVPELIRLYMPGSLFRTFRVIHEANEILINQLRTSSLDKIQIVLGRGVRPTRNSVLDQSQYSILVGGTDYFPASPNEGNLAIPESLLNAYDDKREGHVVGGALLQRLLESTKTSDKNSWPVNAFCEAIEALTTQTKPVQCRLIVRRNRNISRDTGTLLSPNDRALGKQYNQEIVLTAYRLNGEVANQWSGKPFWICNIKLPHGIAFHRGE